MGVSSTKFCNLNVGDEITDLVGPLGKATHIENFGTVVCACGGVGTAPMLPIVAALKQAGNKVITILAARSKDLIILEEQIRNLSDEVIVMTDDGNTQIHFFAINYRLNTISNQTFISVRTIIGHYYHFVRKIANLFFKDYQIL